MELQQTDQQVGILFWEDLTTISSHQSKQHRQIYFQRDEEKVLIHGQFLQHHEAIRQQRWYTFQQMFFSENEKQNGQHIQKIL